MPKPTWWEKTKEGPQESDYLQVMSAIMMLAAEGDSKAEVPVPAQAEDDFEKKWEKMAVSDQLSEDEKKELKQDLTRYLATHLGMPRSSLSRLRLGTASQYLNIQGDYQKSGKLRYMTRSRL